MIDHPKNERAQALMAKVISAIDMPRYMELVRSWEPRSALGKKYIVDPSRTASSASHTAVLLELDLPPIQRVLEVSAGAGFLALAAVLCGHSVFITDQSAEGMYNDFRRLFGVERSGHFLPFTLKKRKGSEPSDLVYTSNKLPSFGVQFDLIIAIALPPLALFSVDDWRWFLQACVDCCPAGRLALWVHRCSRADRGKQALLRLATPSIVTKNGMMVFETKDLLI